MTCSLIARDRDSGAFAGVSATGSLCVGGWVLRGDAQGGMSASQGAAPSTFWGEQAIQAMRAGAGAAQAVEAVTGADKGRDWRQLCAVDCDGGTGAFTGSRNRDVRATRHFDHGVACGNLLAGEGVIEAMAEGWLHARGATGERLLAAVQAAAEAGGDVRGLQSAALLIVRRDRAPLSLRIDYHEQPVAALEALYRRATSGHYASWFCQVPSHDEPERIPDEDC